MKNKKILMNIILIAELLFFLLELGNSGTEKLSILNKATQFTSGKLGFWTWNVCFHASNQTASRVHTPSTSHSTTLAPGFSPKWNGCSIRAGLLILLSTLPSPTPRAPGPSSYFVTTFFIQLPLSFSHLLLSAPIQDLTILQDLALIPSPP